MGDSVVQGFGLKCILSVFSLLVVGITAFADGPVEGRPGYLDSVDGERTERTEELVIISEPKPLASAKPFVSDQLSKEFQTQYETRFGQTEAERNLLPTRYDEYFYNGLYVTYQEDLSRKQSFGNYMVRRVGEYHLDNFMKDNKDLRPVYEAKDTLSHVDLKLNDGYKLNFKYALAGNYGEAVFQNPWHLETKVDFYVGSRELITTLKYPITTQVDILADYRMQSSLVRVVLSRRITTSMSANISATTYTTGSDGEETVDGYIRQRLLLVGFTFRN